MPNIELEHRCLVDKAKHNSLIKFLSKNAKDLGKDDKDVFFFLVPNKILKVVDNTSKKTAKVVLKLNSIGNGSHFEELEIYIDPKDVSSFVKLFGLIEAGEMMQSFQQRHNFIYKGVEIAVKYSDHWQYHVELEKMINDLNKKTAAEKEIFAVAAELGLKIMKDDELKVFIAKLEEDYHQKHHSKH